METRKDREIEKGKESENEKGQKKAISLVNH